MNSLAAITVAQAQHKVVVARVVVIVVWEPLKTVVDPNAKQAVKTVARIAVRIVAPIAVKTQLNHLLAQTVVPPVTIAAKIPPNLPVVQTAAPLVATVVLQVAEQDAIFHVSIPVTPLVVVIAIHRV